MNDVATIATAEPVAGTLKGLLAELEQQRPTQKGTYYELTTTNRIADDALVATPSDVWGRRAADMPTRPAQALVDELHGIVANARASVDIMALGMDFPGGEFDTALKGALRVLARSGRPVTVRMAFGQPAPIPKNLHTDEYIRNLTADLGAIPGAKLKLYVAQVVTQDRGVGPWAGLKSWVHAKILAADAAVALVGGHNWYERDYLPVSGAIFDVSLRVEGPAAVSATKFANRIWKFIRDNNRPGRPGWRTYSSSFDASKTSYANEAAPDFELPETAGPGSVPVMGIADPGLGLLPASGNPRDEQSVSELAMIHFIKNAKHSVYLSQQDLLCTRTSLTTNVLLASPAISAATVCRPKLLRALAQFVIAKRGVVAIVVSTPGAKSPGGAEYAYGHPAETILRLLRENAGDIPGAPKGTELDNLLQEHVLVTNLRFNHDDAAWPGASTFGNHAKFWMVDERVFYIGSHNMYPNVDPRLPFCEGELQEYGFIVEDADAAAIVLQRYWRPLIEYSTGAAVSGVRLGVPPDRFREWKRNATRPVPARRMGESTGKYLFTLSGDGRLVIRECKGGRWDIVAVTRPDGADVTMTGPVSAKPLFAFVASADGRLFQCYEDEHVKGWSWLAHPAPDGQRITALGPMLHTAWDQDPFRFFVAAENGQLYDRYWRAADHVWRWQPHGPQPGGGIAAFGPTHWHPENGVHPFKMFVLGKDGNMYERYRMVDHAGAWWLWAEHGHPGEAIAQIGPLLFDPTTGHPVKVYAITVGGHLAERIWVAAAGRWEWGYHDDPGTLLSSFGPAFQNHDYGDGAIKLFVVGRDGRLYERFWSLSKGTWLWTEHGQPGHHTIVAAGPRTLEQVKVTGPLDIFAITAEGWLFERRRNALGNSWSWLRQWRRDDLPLPRERLGEILHDPTMVFMLSGEGDLVIRRRNAGGDWPVEAALPVPGAAILPGPSISQPRSTFVVNRDGDIVQSYWNEPKKIWEMGVHGRPDGSRVLAMGALLHDPSYRDPFRFFVLAENGRLYDRYFAGNTTWTWQTHDELPGVRIIGLGPLLVHGAFAGGLMKQFVAAENGTVYERYWDVPTQRWGWVDRGRPGPRVRVLGPMLFDPTIGHAIKVFAVTEDRELWELHWDKDAGAWEWVRHGIPGPAARIWRLGPAYLDAAPRDDPAGLFLTATDGRLYERYWSMSGGAWRWREHGQPEGGELVAVGPRMLSQAVVSAPLHVLVMTKRGVAYERQLSEKTWRML